MFSLARIERADRPEKRRDQQDRHTPREMISGRTCECGPNQNSDSDKTADQSEPNDRRRPSRRAAEPTKQRDVNRYRRDKQRGQSGRDPFFGYGDTAVSAQKQTSADNQRRPPCRSFRFRRALESRDPVHDYTRGKETHARHQKRLYRLNREKNSEISRTPNQINCGKRNDDPNSLRRRHRSPSRIVRVEQAAWPRRVRSPTT